MSMPPEPLGTPADVDCFAGGGETGALMRSTDWSRTPLGPAESWPQSLRTIVSLCLGSRLPILIWWGPRWVLLYNDACRLILGSNRHPWALGRDGRDAWPEAWPILGPLLETVWTQGEEACSEDRRLPLDRDGSPAECYVTFCCSPVRDETGNVGGVFCVATETTGRVLDERRRAEALQETEARLQLALAGARAGIWQWDLRTQEVIWSPELYDLLGLERDSVEPSGGRFLEVIHPEDRDKALAEIARATERGGHFEFEFRALRADGQEIWISTLGRVELAAGRQPAVAIGINLDITERKRAELALRDADQRKDEFLAMLAHELRNPLAPIRSAAQVLKLVGPADAHQQWAREVIERQTQHLTRLVDDLLDVSRITQGKVTITREPLDLATLAQRAVEASRPLIEARHHQLTCVLPPEPVRLEGDLTRLVQVIGNLLNNAAKYTDEGGAIHLEATREGAEAIIRVRDNGMGLPADLLPHVFDLFTQADRSLDRSQGGLGIGLTLVRQLVQLHGGRVEARSEGPGRGSEFIVRLPAEAEAAAADAQEAAGAGDRPSVAGLKILLVEDNVDSAEMMAFLLQLGGHEVRIAHDGPAALEAARAFGPEVVLCDIGLPGMNGYEVAARLREQPALQRTPLIALTGYGQEEARSRSREAGFDVHLVKPVEPDALESLLDTFRAKPER